jgi:F-type H+-transporting ATPase subunit a
VNKYTYAIAAIVLLLIGFFLFRQPQPIIEIKPERVFSIGGFDVTNTILTGWVMVIVISLVTILGTRKLSVEEPRGFQNLFEALVEGFGNIVSNVAGEKNGRRFFPLVFAFFFYILLCNWAALTPIFNVIGVTDNVTEHIEHEAHDHPDAIATEEEVRGWVMKDQGGFTMVPLFKKVELVQVEVPEGTTYAQLETMLEEEAHAKLGRDMHEDEFIGFVAPFLRGVNTDVNATFTYALWSAIFVETWGIATLGLFGYGSKFFNFKTLLKGDIVNGIIDLFVGLLELVSELSRLISFTFRLFGNIFAGEVLLFMMSFLVPFLIVDVFYGLELFVGLIQAFVFAMLTLVFAVMAVTSHGDHGDEHGHGEEHGQAAAHGGGH